ncbi:MAG: hypothetical protein AB8B53_03430 [Flavobacteriales bacterium]
MKQFILILITVVLAQLGFSQAAYIDPNPTDGVEELTLFLDISQSVDGTSNNALKALLEDNPDEPVYLWTWMPASPVGGNGEWSSSTEDNRMTKEAPLLYSFTFNLEDFYGVEPSILFQNGISCLAKFKDGAFFEEYGGEAKSEDFTVTIIPKLCDRLFCVFPEIGDADDFWTLTYDNSYEENPDFINAGDNDVYVFLRIRQEGFSSTEYVPADLVTSTPELKMEPVFDEPGHFRFTIIPSDFFDDITVPEDGEFKQLLYYIVVNGQPLPNAQVIRTYGLAPCE